jgi:16S rRNA processing protein RimM
MTDSGPDDLILVGVIGRAHGIKGEVKVVPETDDPERFRAFKRLVFRDARGDREINVLGVRVQTSSKGETPILRLEGVDSREDAEAMRGTKLLVRESDLPIGDDEFFYHDLVGAEAVSEDGGKIGIVRDVIDLPGAATIVLRRDGGDDVLIPIVPEFVRDVRQGRIVLRLIEGMLD